MLFDHKKLTLEVPAMAALESENYHFGGHCILIIFFSQKKLNGPAIWVPSFSLGSGLSNEPSWGSVGSIYGMLKKKDSMHDFVDFRQGATLTFVTSHSTEGGQLKSTELKNHRSVFLSHGTSFSSDRSIGTPKEEACYTTC